MKSRFITVTTLSIGVVVGLLCERPVALAMQALSLVQCSAATACAGGANSSTGSGVNGNSVSGTGVSGGTQHASTPGNPAYGVFGSDGSKTGFYNAGVRGVSERGIGVSGHSVLGDAINGSSTSGNGVTGNSAVSAGVQGQSSKGTGVIGMTFNPSGTDLTEQAGVYGMDLSSDGSERNAGVWGTSNWGPGVRATSQHGPGLFVMSNNGDNVIEAYQSSSQGTGMLLNIANNFGDMINASSSGGNFVADNSGNLTISGTVTTAGSCSVGCSRTHRVRSYGTTSATPTLEDVGEGAVIGGTGTVRFDRAFANAIDPNAGYVVLLTPEGDSRGLYVAQRSATGFVVREMMGGRSNSPFAYRIVARPYGERAARLPYVTLPTPHRLGR